MQILQFTFVIYLHRFALKIERVTHYKTSESIGIQYTVCPKLQNYVVFGI